MRSFLKMTALLAGVNIFFAAPAATIFKAESPNNLNLAGSWSNNVSPGGSDVATWNHLVVTNTNSALGANLNWAGIKILDPAGTVTLSDASNLTNGSSGIDLSLATNGLTLNCPLVLGASQTWKITNGLTLAVGGSISGSRGFTITNGGAVILGTANSYNGGTAINNSIVEPDSINSFGAGAVTNNGAILRLNVLSGTMTNAFIFTKTNIIDLNNRSGISILLDGSFGGSGTVIVSNYTGGGTFTLGGKGDSGGGSSAGSWSAFTGAFIVASTNASGTASSGSIRFNDTSSGANNTGNSSASFDLGNGAITLVTRNPGVTINLGELKGGSATFLTGPGSSGGTCTWSIGGKNTSTTFVGVIKDQGNASGVAALTKVGTGTFTLAGNNTYSGATLISAGALQIGDGVTAGTGTFGTGGVTDNSTLIFARPDAVTVANVINGSGNVLQAGSNILTLTASNNFSGGIIISNNGTILLGANGAIPNGTALMLGGGGTGGTLDLFGKSLKITALTNGASGGIIGNSSNSPATLIFNSTSNSIFSGAIQNSIALQIQNGKLTLNGTNTFFGATVISGGTLALGANGSISNSPAIVLSGVNSTFNVSAVSGFSLAGGQVFSGIGAVAGNFSATSNLISPATNGTVGTLTFSNNLTLNGGNTLNFDLSTSPGFGNDQLLVASNLNLSGMNTLQINPLSGTLVIGTYKLIKFGALGSGGAANLQWLGSVGNGLQGAISVTATEVDLVVSPGAGSSLVWQGDGAANLWDQTSTNWIYGNALSDFGDGDFAIFNDATTNNVVNLTGTLQPGSITVDATNNYIIAGSGSIFGALVLTKTNSGALIILTTNFFNGVTTIMQGRVQLGNGLLGGTLGNSLITDNGILQMQSPVPAALNNFMSGSGQLVQAGPGMVTLASSNIFSGGTSISNGTILSVGTNGALGFGNVLDNGTLDFNSAGNVSLNNSISGGGSVSLSGKGTVALAGNNFYGGGTIVSNGVLQMANVSGSATGSGAVTVASGGTISGTGTISGALTISSGGNLSAGIFSGPLTINNDVTVNSGAVLNFQINTNNNFVAVAGNLILGSAINVTNAAGLPDGTYPLFAYGGSLTFAASLGATPSGRFYSLNTNLPGQINLVIAHVPGGGNGSGAPVTVTDNGSTVTLDNGIVQIVITKSDAHISTMNYQGQNLMSGGNTGGKFYWSWNQPNFQGPATTSYSLVQDPATNGGAIVEVDLFSQWSGNASDAALDVDIHYFLVRGAQGFYAGCVNSHPPSYPDNPGGEFRMVGYVGSTFDWLSVDNLRNRLMSPPATSQIAVPGAPQENTLWTAGIYQGQYECKYGYSADFCDESAWGWSSTAKNLGIWMTKPSQEYYSGGPMKRELMCHEAPTLLNMVNGTHYTMGSDGDIKAGENFSKTFGPWLIYANSVPLGTSNAPAVLFADAQAQARAEQGAWPYDWWSNTNYIPKSGRGTVTGKIKISDSQNPNASAAGLWVGVAQAPPSSLGSADFQYWEKNLQFWVKSDANGNFVISNVVPGANYTLFAFGPGATGTFQSQALTGSSFSTLNIPTPQFSVTVTAGATNNLGTVTWTPTRVGATVFEIGVADRNATEFLHGNDWWQGDIGPSPAQPSPFWMKSFDYALDFPGGLIYTVGQSKWSTGWNFAHSALGTNATSTETWKIFFNLPQAPASSASASLYIGVAADYQGPIKVVANSTTVTSGTSPPSHSDDTMIRLGIHGVFSDMRLNFAGSALHAGQNEIDLTMTATGSVEKSAMYDYLRLELSGYIPPAPVNLTAAVNNSQVSLNWTAMSGATSYIVKRAGSLNGTYTFIATNLFAPVVGSGITNVTYLDAAAQAGTNYYIVASVNPNGSTNSSPVFAVLPVIVPQQPPQIDGVRLQNGNFIFTGSGGTSGQIYYVLTSTNVALPVAQWSRVRTNNFDGSGNFGFTNNLNMNPSQVFYLIQVP